MPVLPPAAALLAALAFSLVHAAEPPKPAPNVYALVSAVGSSLTLVRQEFSTGSNIKGFQRFERPVPDATLHAAVLRGLEDVIRQSDPDAEFVYMALNPEELSRVWAYERDDVALGKVVAHLEKSPERAKWHRIVIVTPLYMNSGREGLGEKLHGIGIFVQPMRRDFSTYADQVSRRDPSVTSPEGEGYSSNYLAPFFYTRTTVLDARTLEVLASERRYDFERLYDPDSTAMNIEEAIPPEKLGPIVSRFVERTSARAMRAAIGVVTVSEPKVVEPAR